MSKFDNHVYMTICESSYELFEKTRFGTYQNFCWTIKNEIRTSTLTKTSEQRLCYVSMVIEKLFAFDPPTGMQYVIDFFYKEKYAVFEVPVRYMIEYYPMNDGINRLIEP